MERTPAINQLVVSILDPWQTPQAQTHVKAIVTSAKTVLTITKNATKSRHSVSTTVTTVLTSMSKLVANMVRSVLKPVKTVTFRASIAWIGVSSRKTKTLVSPTPCRYSGRALAWSLISPKTPPHCRYGHLSLTPTQYGWICQHHPSICQCTTSVYKIPPLSGTAWLSLSSVQVLKAWSVWIATTWHSRSPWIHPHTAATRPLFIRSKSLNSLCQTLALYKKLLIGQFLPFLLHNSPQIPQRLTPSPPTDSAHG